MRETLLKQAERFVQQGKLEAALDEYRKILRATPRDLVVANTVGDLYARLGRHAEAIEHYANIAKILETAGHLSRATAVHKKIVKLDPSNAEALRDLAMLYAKQGLVGEAASQYAATAKAYQRAGRLHEAVRVLGLAAEMTPESGRTRLELARAVEALGNTREAAEGYRVAGQLFLRRGRLDDAIAALDNALALAPESRSALKMLAEAHARRGDVAPALELVARALEVDPNDIDLIIILGRTFLNAGMLDRAERTFERLFRLDNSRYDYLLEVAGAYVVEGSYESAMSIVDSCVEVILARRRKKKATAILKSILERDPSNIHALKRLAGLYRAARERRNLVNTLNTIVKVALEQDMRSEAVAALRQLVEIEPKKRAYQEQLADINRQEPKGLALYEEAAVEKEESDAFDSYGDYSTELLEDMVAQHPEFLAARLRLLEELVEKQPSYVEGRQRLMQIYVDAGRLDEARAEALALAGIYEERGDETAALRYLAEAESLDAQAPKGTKAEKG